MLNRLGSEILTTLLVIVMFASNAVAQSGFKSEDELIRNAEKFFSDKSYEKAFPLYSQIVSNRPENSYYNYCLGVCIMKVASDKAEAVRFLEVATKSPQNPVDSWLYLGNALHASYRSDEAIAAFENYKLNASRSSWNSSKGDLLIKMCQNSLDAKNDLSLQRHRILEKSETERFNFFNLYRNLPEVGRFLKLPKEYEDKNTKGEAESDWLFMPQGGNILIYSNASKNNQNGYDIFSVIKDQKGAWMFPEMLSDIINTSGEEAFPVVVNDGKTLYFSSKGDRSTGGYDIFSSNFNVATGSWSEPQSMGPPVNSPGDDFYYIPAKDNQVAYFSSNRESAQGKCNVYKAAIINENRNFIAISGLFNCSAGLDLSDAKVTILNPDDKAIIAQFRTPSQKGEYSLKLPVPSKFLYHVELVGFNTQEELVDLSVFASRELIQEIMLVREETGKEKMTISHRIPIESNVIAGNTTKISSVNSQKVSESDMSMSTPKSEVKNEVSVNANETPSTLAGNSEDQKLVSNATQPVSSNAIGTEQQYSSTSNSSSPPVSTGAASKSTPEKQESLPAKSTLNSNAENTDALAKNESNAQSESGQASPSIVEPLVAIVKKPDSNKSETTNSNSGAKEKKEIQNSTAGNTENSNSEAPISTTGSLNSDLKDVVVTDQSGSTNVQASNSSVNQKQPLTVANNIEKINDSGNVINETSVSKDTAVIQPAGIAQNRVKQETSFSPTTSTEKNTSSKLNDPNSNVAVDANLNNNKSQTIDTAGNPQIEAGSNKDSKGAATSATLSNENTTLKTDQLLTAKTNNETEKITALNQEIPYSNKDVKLESQTQPGEKANKSQDSSLDINSSSDQAKTGNDVASQNQLPIVNLQPVESKNMGIELLADEKVADNKLNPLISNGNNVYNTETNKGAEKNTNDSEIVKNTSSNTSGTNPYLLPVEEKEQIENPSVQNAIASDAKTSKISSDSENGLSSSSSTNPTKTQKTKTDPSATVTTSGNENNSIIEETPISTSNSAKPAVANVAQTAPSTNTDSKIPVPSNDEKNQKGISNTTKENVATSQQATNTNQGEETKNSSETKSQLAPVYPDESNGSIKVENSKDANSQSDGTGNTTVSAEKKSGIFSSLLRKKKKQEEKWVEIETTPANEVIIPVDELSTIYKNLIFRVQVGAYRDRKVEDLKKKFAEFGLNDLIYVKNEEGLLLVMTGSENNYKSATTIKTQLIEKGITDAFIVVYSDGSRIPLKLVVQEE